MKWKGACQCVSLYCQNTAHVDLRCNEEARLSMISRDWGHIEVGMCVFCAKSARMSGMFVDA